MEDPDLLKLLIFICLALVALGSVANLPPKKGKRSSLWKDVTRIHQKGMRRDQREKMREVFHFSLDNYKRDKKKGEQDADSEKN